MISLPLSDPWVYLPAGVAALIWLGKLAIGHYVRKTVDHRFDRRIEDHKHELQQIIEHERFDMQRRLAGASLYLQTQHAAAAELYCAVRKAEGSLARVFMPADGFRLNGSNETDLRERMAQEEMLSGSQERLLELWRSDPGSFPQAFTAHVTELRLPLALNDLQKARNLVVMNEIYFSDETRAALIEFGHITTHIVNVAGREPWKVPDPAQPPLAEFYVSVSRVTALLRAELSDPPSAPIRRSLR